MNSDINDKIELADVMSFIKKYEFKIDSEKSTDEKLVLRLPFTSKEEVENFRHEFASKTSTKWAVYNDVTKRTKNFHKVWICHHSGYRKEASSRRNANCPAKLGIKIVELTPDSVASDIFLRQATPLRTVVTISLKHTHTVNSAEILKASSEPSSTPIIIKVESNCREIFDKLENNATVSAEENSLKDKRVEGNQSKLQEIQRLGDSKKQDCGEKISDKFKNCAAVSAEESSLKNERVEDNQTVPQEFERLDDSEKQDRGEISIKFENCVSVSAEENRLKDERVEENQSILQEFQRLGDLVKQDSFPKDIASHLLQTLKNIKTKEDFRKLTFSRSIIRAQYIGVQPASISRRIEGLSRSLEGVPAKRPPKL